ncbi:binary toxin-like calcium binding domain-containing protein, partial [Paenibacillus larvae]
VETFSIPEIISFESLPMGTDSRTENKLPDTDEDGICDEWEVNGYYVKNNIAVFPWPKEGSQEEKELIKQGFKKFVSNPYESHTAGDPYSDLEKASGALDRTIHKVARDPLVAAYPSITVGMEELILSNNENISSTKGKTVSRSTSSSVSDSNTLGIDVSTGFSLFQGFSASVTGHYSHSSTHTVDSSNTSGQDWQHQLELNTGQSAYMNANVRYYNTGTAPVYNLVPTTNLVLGRQTIATVTGQLNQRSLSLTPGQTYPKQHLHGVALNTIDQFSSAPIALNINQLDRLESGEKLKLETTQFQGAFAKRSPAGGQVVLEENEWAHYMPQIESMTAGILINMGGNRFIERRVAAKDPLNPNDRTPELTLGEALEKSIGMFLDKENKNFYFIDEETGNRHIISPDLVHLVFDKKTEKKIKEEQERKPDIKTIYGMTIRPEMNIQINVPVLYDDFTKNSDKWSGGDYDTEHALYKGQCYEIGKEKEGVYRNFSLERNATYLIVMAVKGSPTKDKNIIVEIDGITGVKEFGNFKVDKDYKYEKMVLKTFGDMENHLKLHIKNNTNDPIYIDNFSIVKIGRGIDELEKENIEYAKNIKYTDKFYIYGISGEKIITNDRSLPVMKNKGETEQQKFSIQYWGNGTCKIIDTSTGHVVESV